MSSAQGLSKLVSSPGAAPVFAFDANDPASTVLDANGAVEAVRNALNPAQYLKTETGSAGIPVVIAANGGAAGRSRVLQFRGTHLSPNSSDPAANWLSAIAGAGNATLINLANSSDIDDQGSFTTIIALKVDDTYSYESGPIWGALAAPGPLQYVQLRMNSGTHLGGADLSAAGQQPQNAQSAISDGWHVMTIIKDRSTLTYRLDGSLVQTITLIGSASFKATDFMIGGGFPQGSGADLNHENGVPVPDVGDFQAYSGVLAGSDLASGEQVAASSIGLAIAAPAGRVVNLPATATFLAAQSGDTVYASAGAATVTAFAGSVLMVGNAGPLEFSGGSAASTVTGGAGSDTVFGGSGGGAFAAGRAGGSILVAGGGNTTLRGAAAGDRLFGAAGGHDLLVAGAGLQTLVGGSGGTTITGGTTAGSVIFTAGDNTVLGGAAGNDTVVAGPGTLDMQMHADAVFTGSGNATVDGGTSGNDAIIGGAGALDAFARGANMLVVGGAGGATIATGNGSSLVFAGSGAMNVTEGAGPGTVAIGRGALHVAEGAGGVTFDVVRGTAGGSAIIDGFKRGTDHIALFGYGSTAVPVASAGGNAVIDLPDGTRITLVGLSDPGTILLG